MFDVCSMNIHYRFYEIEYFFEKCFENEIHYVELWLCPQHFFINGSTSCIDIDYIENLTKKYEIKISCLCPEQNNPKPNNLASRNEFLVNNSLNYFKEVILLAEKLKVNKVLLTSGWAYYDEPVEKAWERSIKHMRILADFAEKHQVKICVEPLQPIESKLVNNLESMSKYLNEVDRSNVCVALDLGALGKANESMEEWFETFHDRIIHIHYVDGTPTGHMPIGRGNRNILEDMECLIKNNYSGVLSFEFANSMSFDNPSKHDLDSKKLIEEALKKIRKGGEL